MTITSMFLVLSDLHFARDLMLQPEIPPLEASRFLKIISHLKKKDDISEFFIENCRGHSVECVTALPRCLKSILAQAQEQDYPNDNFDLCILLGDQVTFADASSYKFLREYLTQERYKTGNANLNHSCKGLGFNRDQIIAIPGNHDKLLRQNLSLYNSEFSVPLSLPNIAPQRAEVVIKIVGGRKFLFLLVEASKYCKNELLLDINCRKHLAAGEITQQLKDDISNHLVSIDEDVFARILLVHYAVDAKQLSHSLLTERLLPHSCDGLDDLVEELRLKFSFDIVLHGHLHVPGIYRHMGTQVVAATTTTQEGPQNGFYVLKVFDTGEIRAEHHCWNGKTFAEDPNRSLTKPLEVTPKGAAA